MKTQNRDERKHIKHFNPEVRVLGYSFQDYSLLEKFNAGDGYSNFNEFLKDDALDFRKDGEGVTHVILDSILDDEGNEIEQKVVAFVTFMATAIPFEDRIRNDEEEYKKTGKKYNSETLGVSAVEIRMFAVDVDYQDVFYEFDGTDLPIAAWIMRLIVLMLDNLIREVIGFKVVYLHSLPEDIDFYKRNGFEKVKKNMQPLYSVDEDYTPMFLTLRPFVMNYDD